MRPQQKTSSALSFAAPTGGIDDITPLAAMDPKYCIKLDNMYPGTSAVEVRRGYSEWVTGLSGPVKTLMPMYLSDGSSKLFACTDSGVYDVSTKGVAGSVVYTITNGKVNFTQYSNVAGQYLICCNGVDPAFMYDGTKWITFTQTNTPTSPGQIKGVNPSSFLSPLSFKHRVWFCQAQTMTLWYLDTDAIGGTATPFYVGGAFSRGGSIVGLASWSYDGGAGLDDKFVVQSTTGEVAVYAGNDPSEATTWALQGLFFIASPMGSNAFAELGGDTLLLTRTGVVAMSKIVQGSANQALYEDTLSRRINKTLNSLFNSVAVTPNWDIHNLQIIQSLMITIPKTSSTEAMQFLMNTTTGAWCRYTLPLRCVSIFSKNIYFGGEDGTIYLFGNTHYDAVKLDGTGGIPVLGSLFSAFNYLGDPTSTKHFKLVRPIFQSSNAPNYLAQINTDYDLSPLSGTPSPESNSSDDSLWDQAIWDESVWSSLGTVYSRWMGLANIGYCGALLLKVRSVNATAFVACEVVYEVGTGLI